jgi:hypothetical protein
MFGIWWYVLGVYPEIRIRLFAFTNVSILFCEAVSLPQAGFVIHFIQADFCNNQKKENADEGF